MIIPLTSTTVATNGADETAGSKPKRDSMNGNIAPIKLPNKTIDNKLNAITKRSNFSSKRSLENFLNFNLLGSLIFNAE